MRRWRAVGNRQADQIQGDIEVTVGLANGKMSGLHKADQLRDRKMWAEAAEAYAQVLEKQPDQAPLWVQLGHALKESGKRDEAEAAYLRSVELDAANPDTYLQLGHLKKLQGQLERSAFYYARALDFDPEQTDAARELEALRMKGIHIPKRIIKLPAKLPEIEQAFGDDFAVLTQAGVVDVSVVGKFGTSNGIAIHSDSFLRCLRSVGASVQAIDTRPDESDSNYKSRVTDVSILEDHRKAKPSLVSIYCDVIANSEADFNYRKLPKSGVKLAYAVFDSSRIPAYWATRLNEFDAVAVPDPWLVEVLHRSGVRRPVFSLPLALDYSSLQPQKDTPERQATDEAFVFGCVAGFGLRKNLKSLIDAFYEVFAGQPHVFLHIHSTLNFSNHFEELQHYIAEKGIDNILLTCENLSEGKYARMFRSFDAYVNVSKGEGYSITPRQALYLGIPTILSDNTAHRTLVKTGLAVGVRTCSFEAAHFEGLDGIDCGYQCVPDDADLRRALLDVYVNHRRYRARSAEMKAVAERYTTEALKWRYQGFAFPKSVFLAEENYLDRNYMVTSDVTLYEKMKKVISLAKDHVPERARQRISVVGHDGGFFSLFNTFVSHLVWNVGRHEVTSIVPDWRVSRIMKHRGLERFTSFCYGQRGDGNLWLKFFYPVLNQEVGEDLYNDEEYLDSCIAYDDFNEKNEPNLTYIHAYKLYKDPEFPKWRKWYNAHLREYVAFREHLLTEAEVFAANNFDADHIIGCHVRHPSHGIEQPGRGMPTVELFQQHVIRRATGLKNWKVFLATDQESVVESFKAVFGDRLIYRDASRVTLDDDRRFAALSETEQQREGHQIQHLTAADEARWSTRMGDDVIVDALLLAKCDTFIHVTSNIATAVAFLNPDVEMIYCE